MGIKLYLGSCGLPSSYEYDGNPYVMLLQKRKTEQLRWSFSIGFRAQLLKHDRLLLFRNVWIRKNERTLTQQNGHNAKRQKQTGFTLWTLVLLKNEWKRMGFKEKRHCYFKDGCSHWSRIDYLHGWRVNV